jgi:D-glycero-D-manno-heptose 1,7-bisphosphate phosphatase
LRPHPDAARRLVLLDRDGTINVDKGYVRDPRDVELVPGAGAAIRRLRELGLKVGVISNQSGVGRGLMTEDDVARVNVRLVELLAGEEAHVDGFFLCVHAPWDDCACRKPKTVLLERAAEKLGGDLTRSFMVGDKVADVDAGRAAGAFTILVRTGYGEDSLAAGATPDAVAADLAEAAGVIERGLRPLSR